MPLDRLLQHTELCRWPRAHEKRPGKTVEAEPHQKWAAIAVVLRLDADDAPELLMIKRAEIDRDPWSGHIACPGGRMEPGDRDLAHTAMRETLEETGIDIEKNGRILGTLDDVSPRTPVLPPIIIRPFVVAVTRSVEILQSSEVAEAFWVPLAALRATNAWGTSTVRVRGVDREELTFTHKHYTVWGLTHRVLLQLMQRLAP